LPDCTGVVDGAWRFEPFEEFEPFDELPEELELPELGLLE
jgi:hypothetical protein